MQDRIVSIHNIPYIFIKVAADSVPCIRYGMGGAPRVVCRLRTLSFCSIP